MYEYTSYIKLVASCLITLPESEHSSIVNCEGCGDEIFWDWKDSKDHSKQKWPFQAHRIDDEGNPERHFCRPCGATGYDTPGCGMQIVQRKKEYVANGKEIQKKIMVLAGSKEKQPHECKWVREARIAKLQARRKLEESNYLVDENTDPETLMPPSSTHHEDEDEDEDEQQQDTEAILKAMNEDLKAIKREVQALKETLKRFFPSLDLD